jgi:hypothetical protein
LHRSKNSGRGSEKGKGAGQEGVTPERDMASAALLRKPKESGTGEGEHRSIPRGAAPLAAAAGGRIRQLLPQPRRFHPAAAAEEEKAEAEARRAPAAAAAAPMSHATRCGGVSVAFAVAAPLPPRFARKSANGQRRRRNQERARRLRAKNQEQVEPSGKREPNAFSFRPKQQPALEGLPLLS